MTGNTELAAQDTIRWFVFTGQQLSDCFHSGQSSCAEIAMHAPKGFWTLALSVAGFGAVGAFVFYMLYRQWLTLPIFDKLTKEQTFEIMKLFLILVFLALALMAVLWFLSQRQSPKPVRPEEAQALSALDKSWDGVRKIDCKKISAPMAIKAANALSMTATFWKKEYVSRDALVEQYLQNFHDLVPSMLACERVLPGFETENRRCCDLITTEVQQVYEEMKNYA